MAIEPIAIVVLKALADAPADVSGFGMDGYEPTQIQAALGELQRGGLILTGPIKFTPVRRDGRDGYAFRGEVSAAAILSGFVDVSVMTMASPTGSSIVDRRISGSFQKAA